MTSKYLEGRLSTPRVYSAYKPAGKTNHQTETASEQLVHLEGCPDGQMLMKRCSGQLVVRMTQIKIKTMRYYFTTGLNYRLAVARS